MLIPQISLCNHFGLSEIVNPEGNLFKHVLVALKQCGNQDLFFGFFSGWGRGGQGIQVIKGSVFLADLP